MCGLALIAGYGLAVTTLFVFIQYPRMNTPYDPLMLTVVWCSVALVAPRAMRLIRHRVEQTLLVGVLAGRGENAL
jgi:hypothetical protein